MIKPILTSVIMSVLALTACSQADAPKIETPAAKVMQTKTKAVLIYADWCSSCKVLDPKLKEVKALGPMPGLEYVTLDYTDKDTSDFYAQADAAGVGEAVRIYLDGTISTGVLLLVDVDDKKVVKKVTKTFETKEIAKAMKEAIEVS